MLVNHVLVALLLGVGEFGVPSTLFHDLLDSENGVFVVVMTVDAVQVFHQVTVFDVPPAIPITDFRDVPCGVANGAGDELADFYRSWHGGLLWVGLKKATCRNDKPPWVVGLEDF